MKRGIRWYLFKGMLTKDPAMQKRASRFVLKAKNNLVTMSILFELQHNKGAKSALNVPLDYDPDEWVVVCAYYAMYMAASAVLARLGYRSSSHTATVLALEAFFVNKQLLERKYLALIEKLRFGKEYIDDLRLAMDKREIAQYSVTKETTRRIAENIKDDAYDFVGRMERILVQLGLGNH